ncbi:unnamed protein product, partial [Brassica oleracea]
MTASDGVATSTISAMVVLLISLLAASSAFGVHLTSRRIKNLWNFAIQGSSRQHIPISNVNLHEPVRSSVLI